MYRIGQDEKNLDWAGLNPFYLKDKQRIKRKINKTWKKKAFGSGKTALKSFECSENGRIYKKFRKLSIFQAKSQTYYS